MANEKIIKNPKTTNELFYDALVRHQVYLAGLDASMRRQILDHLNASEADIVELITRRLAKAPGGLSSTAELVRLETLMRMIVSVREQAWKTATDSWITGLKDFAKQEAKALATITATTSPVLLDLALPSPQKLSAIVTSSPFEGRVLRSWAAAQKAEDLRRIEAQLRLGMTAGEPAKTIARRVVGTRALGGTDGVTAATRRAAEAIARTAINHVGSEARAQFYRENRELFPEEQYVATLDGATTPICRALDGQRFKVGEGPQTPQHFNCRSLRVPALDPEFMATRPQKPVTERQMLREFSEQNGFKAPATRAGLPRGMKGAFDKFARQRTRELVGQIPASVNYQTWLMGQSKEFQDDVLGATKAKLFREGGLTLDKFVGRTGSELSLADLAKKEASAFRAAGLDPSDYV